MLRWMRWQRTPAAAAARRERKDDFWSADHATCLRLVRPLQRGWYPGEKRSAIHHRRVLIVLIVTFRPPRCRTPAPSPRQLIRNPAPCPRPHAGLTIYVGRGGRRPAWGPRRHRRGSTRRCRAGGDRCAIRSLARSRVRRPGLEEHRPRWAPRLAEPSGRAPADTQIGGFQLECHGRARDLPLASEVPPTPLS